MLGGWRVGLSMAMALGCGVIAGAYPPDAVALLITDASYSTDDVLSLSGYNNFGLSDLGGFVMSTHPSCTEMGVGCIPNREFPCYW